MSIDYLTDFSGKFAPNSPKTRMTIEPLVASFPLF
jgi:hypothetical protein